MSIEGPFVFVPYVFEKPKHLIPMIIPDIIKLSNEDHKNDGVEMMDSNAFLLLPLETCNVDNSNMSIKVDVSSK